MCDSEGWNASVHWELPGNSESKIPSLRTDRKASESRHFGARVWDPNLLKIAENKDPESRCFGNPIRSGENHPLQIILCLNQRQPEGSVAGRQGWVKGFNL